ncbi:MAG TPA: amidohydrolase family protein [Burkholderiaceae bacterium]|nr:amidohydrolase family protein [Burkholderiaceae bacterium]
MTIVNGKIAVEEHWDSPDVDTTGSFSFIDGSYFAKVSQRLKDVDRRIDDMDACGIATAVISLTQPGIEGVADRRRAVDLARRMNDHAANELARRHPQRLRTFACVPLQDPEAAALELRRACDELGCLGALVNGFSNVGDDQTAQYLDEPQVAPFWQCVSDLDVPVYLHPRMPLPSQRRIYQGYAGLVGSTWGFGVETATHALRLMLSGLFDRHPSINVILGHLGEGLPFTLPRVEHRLRHQQGQDSHGAHRKPPMHYLCNNFYLTTSGTFRTQALLNTMLETGSDRLLFAVDYPYESMREISAWFDDCPIGPADKAKIGAANARRLFKLAS